MIYLFATEGDEFCKVGFAKSPRRRLNSMRGHCPFELRIVATRDGGCELERAVHRLARPHRVRAEWYRFSEEMLDIFHTAAPLAHSLPPIRDDASESVLDETCRLATAAFEASGCATHVEFVEMFGGAIGLRTLRSWLRREFPAAPMARLALREFAAGWRPTRIK